MEPSKVPGPPKPTKSENYSQNLNSDGQRLPILIEFEGVAERILRCSRCGRTWPRFCREIMLAYRGALCPYCPGQPRLEVVKIVAHVRQVIRRQV